MVDTVLATGYGRAPITVNADGSFGIVAFPSVSSSILTNVAGAGTATWVAVASSNVSSITAQTINARLISGGVRVFALFPETSASGVLFAGVLPYATITTLASTTITNLIASSSSEVGMGTRGARACFLPLDNNSFAFTTQLTNAYAGTSTNTSACPYIIGSGFPVGTIIWYEFVINIEGLPSVGSAALGVDPSGPSDTASNWFVSPERLFTAAKTIMGNTTVMDAAEHLGGMASPALGNSIRRVRSAFGNGSHFKHAQLVAGASAARQSRESTVLIEEMKESEYHLLK